MKKYTVIVDEDYQAFNENCNITLDEIDLKIQAPKQGVGRHKEYSFEKL